MPNGISYTTGATPSTCLRKGNFLIGNNTADYGGTFYSSIVPPTSGYTIYSNKASQGPSIYVANNDSDLIRMTTIVGGPVYTSATQSLTWFATQTDNMVFNIDYPSIVTNGLVLNVDAGFTPSYPTSGFTWYDISGSGNTGTLINGPTYSSANGGSIVFDGVDDRVNCGNQSNTQSFSTITLSTWVNFNGLDYTGNTGVLSSFIGKGVPDTAPGVPSAGFWLTYDNRNNRSTFTYTCFGNISGGFGGGGNGFSNKTYTFMNGSWYNIVATVNGTPQGTLFINGIQQGSSVSFSGLNLSNTANNLYLGSVDYGLPLKGRMSTSQIYNRALSTSEVLQNYQAMFTRFLGENIVTNGLQFYLDAGYPLSYPTSGITWNNISGISGGTGTLTNGPTYSSANGGSIVFDGVDDYVDCGNNPIFNITNLTMSAWIYPTSVTGLREIMAYELCYKIRLNGQNIQVLIGNGTAWTSIPGTSNNPININTWYNISLTVADGGNAIIYLNGSQVAFQGFGSTIGTNNRKFYVGAYDGGSANEFFSGNIPIAQVYNRVLSSSEILQNYNAQKSRYGL
jgi:hypothetical protein